MKKKKMGARKNNKWIARKRYTLLLTTIMFAAVYIIFSLYSGKKNKGGARRADTPVPDLKLPLPGNKSWLLTVEAGGKAFRGGDDRFHKNGGYFSLDFDDINAQDGPLSDVPVLASGDGKVVYVCRSIKCRVTGSGYSVAIDHSTPYNDTGYKTLYGHLKKPPQVSEGQMVKQGEFIGVIGSTGFSGGTHLHFRLFYNGSSDSSTEALREVMLDGRPIEEYKVNPKADSLSTYKYYPSTNISKNAPEAKKRK